MEEDNGLQNRLHKILKIIEDCKYGIHDISRTQSNSGGYPRFNMPFELGLFYACMHYGKETQKKKNAVIFEAVKYSYQQSISDLNGVDTKDHNNDFKILIAKLRNWLATASKRRNIPGPDIIKNDFNAFEIQYPAILGKLGFQIDNVQFNDLCTIIEDWLALKLL